mmetsp:Transcript_97636/g.173917  ORF Transcript_97636/g.173917 Transcript_97636/m.173917 type:complete len:167 (-) Transcript_97636:4-504(-)
MSWSGLRMQSCFPAAGLGEYAADVRDISASHFPEISGSAVSGTRPETLAFLEVMSGLVDKIEYFLQRAFNNSIMTEDFLNDCLMSDQYILDHVVFRHQGLRPSLLHIPEEFYGLAQTVPMDRCEHIHKYITGQGFINEFAQVVPVVHKWEACNSTEKIAEMRGFTT